MTEPRPVRPGTAVLVALAVGAVSYALLRMWVDAGRAFPHPSWLELGALLLIAATTLVLGRRVRRMALRLEGARVSPVTAARTFVLAQASVVTGAVLAGAHAGAFLELVPVASATGTWGGAVRTLVLALVSGVVALVGLLVQRWCRRPDEPTDAEGDDVDPAG